MIGKGEGAAALFEGAADEPGEDFGILLPITSLAMSLCASYPWLLWLGVSFSSGGWGRPVLSYPVVIALSAGGLFMSYFFQKRSWPLGLIRAAVLSCGGALVALAWMVEYGSLAAVFTGGRPAPLVNELFNLQRPYLLALLAAIFFWWQGQARGGVKVYYSRLSTSFGRGLAALIVLVLLLNWQVPRFALPGLLPLQESAAAYLAAFFLLGLAALSLSTHQSFTGAGVSRKELRRVFNRRFLALVAAVLALIFLAGAVLTGAVSYELWSLLLRLLAPVGAFLSMILYHMMVPLSHAGEWLVDLLRSLRVDQEVPPNDVNVLPSPEASQWDVMLRTLSPEALAVLQWVLLVLLLGLITFLVARSIRARSRLFGEALEEFHESFFSWALFKKDLLQLPGSIRGLFRAGSRAREAVKRFLPRGGTFRSIRELYRALLAEASRRGVKRLAPETPHEYGDRLRREVPPVAGEIDSITRRYVEERYGYRRFTPSELSESAAGWRNIKAALKQLNENY